MSEPPSPAPAPPGAGQPPGPPLQSRVERILTGSLILAMIPVAVLILAAVAAFAYGTAVFIDLVVEIARHPFPVGHKIGLFLLDTDLFLIGATLLISGVGFYELFIREIGPNGAGHLPHWLEMRDLNDLKGRVIAMIVMVLAVSFVELAVDASDGLFVLELGGGVALVIIALTAFIRLTGHGTND